MIIPYPAQNSNCAFAKNLKALPEYDNIFVLKKECIPYDKYNFMGC